MSCRPTTNTLYKYTQPISNPQFTILWIHLITHYLRYSAEDSMKLALLPSDAQMLDHMLNAQMLHMYSSLSPLYASTPRNMEHNLLKCSPTKQNEEVTRRSKEPPIHSPNPPSIHPSIHPSLIYATINSHRSVA